MSNVPPSLKESRLPAAAVLVWQAIETFRRDDPSSWPGNRKILEQLPIKMTLRTLQRHKALLQRAGFLEVTSWFDIERNGRQTTNRYRPTLPTEKNAGDDTSVMGEGDSAVMGGTADIIKAFGFDSYSERQNTCAPEIRAPSGVRAEQIPKEPPNSEEAAIEFVFDAYQRKTGRRLFLPDQAETALKNLLRFHGAAGLMAMYELWWRPGRRWSKWAGTCGHSIGGLVHDQDKILDDPEWRTLRRAFSERVWVIDPALNRVLAGIGIGPP